MEGDYVNDDRGDHGGDSSAFLCCAKNRRCKLFCVTSPLTEKNSSRKCNQYATFFRCPASLIILAPMSSPRIV